MTSRPLTPLDYAALNFLKSGLDKGPIIINLEHKTLAYLPHFFPTFYNMHHNPLPYAQCPTPYILLLKDPMRQLLQLAPR